MITSASASTPFAPSSSTIVTSSTTSTASPIITVVVIVVVMVVILILVVVLALVLTILFLLLVAVLMIIVVTAFGLPGIVSQVLIETSFLVALLLMLDVSADFRALSKGEAWSNVDVHIVRRSLGFGTSQSIICERVDGLV